MPLFFTYGTLKREFPNHEAHAEKLSHFLGPFRTVSPYPLIVPNAPACPNPGCPFEHRIGVLVYQSGTGSQVEGELFDISSETLHEFDALENYHSNSEEESTYLRRTIEVEPEMGGESVSCEVYFVADAENYLRLVECGSASMISRYTIDMASGTLKACCQSNPDHDGPHDVISL